MPKINSINIPTPCHQPWQQMTAVEGGRYCQGCCKTVTDFTVMTDAQVINYLSRKTNVCGRFDHHQLTRLNERLNQSRSFNGFFRKAAIAATILMAIPFVKANAQRKHKTEQIPVKFKRRDTLAIISKHFTGADIKIAPGLPAIQQSRLNDLAPQLNSLVGGLQVTGVYITPAIHRVYTSIYDMLRDL